MYGRAGYSYSILQLQHPTATASYSYSILQLQHPTAMASFPPERLKCTTCKRFQAITNYPFRRGGFHTHSCSTCQIRLQNRYRKQRGIPVSEEGKVYQIQQATRQATRQAKNKEKQKKLAQENEIRKLIQRQKRRIQWRLSYNGFANKGKEEWIQRQQNSKGFWIDIWITQAQWQYVKAYESNFDYQAYSQWIDLRKQAIITIANREGWKPTSQEIITELTNLINLTSTDLTEHTERPIGELIEEPVEEYIGKPVEPMERLTEPVEEPEPGEEPVELIEGFTEPVEEPVEELEPVQEFTELTKLTEPTEEPNDEPFYQYCSSCNQDKLEIEYDGFRTCRSCRQRSRNNSRRQREEGMKASAEFFKATREQIELHLEIWTQKAGERSLIPLRKDWTRPLTVDDYIAGQEV
ncbi:hypothetical protein B7463_g4753, partial [Scytalidium lignicola]